MITAISWVPKGIAKSVPSVAEPPTKEEIEDIIKSGALEFGHDDYEEEEEDVELEADNEVDEVLGNSSNDIANALKELDMDNYDDEDDDGIQLFNKGIVGDSYYPSNEMDPYLNGNYDEDSEEEDMTIKPDDLVIVCAREGNDVSQLEVYILDEAEDGSPNLFVHHDIIISASPLCTAWSDCPLKGGEKGNFIAVGSTEPSIEIWDLDIIDEVQPCSVLGGKVVKRKKGKKKSIKYKEGSHTDSILDLAWNKEIRNILASASADNSVKIWDVATEKCKITMNHHTDKVQAVAWNPHEPEILISGSFDHSVVLKDGREPNGGSYKWSVDADVQCLAWNPQTPHSFVVCLDNGMIQGFERRMASSNSKQTPSFTLHAHDEAVCTVSFNPAAPNLIATGSTDKMVQLWDLSNNQPSCVASRNPKAGEVFSVSFCDDKPLMLAIGGSNGKLQVWDTLSDNAIAQRYGKFRHKNSL